MRMREAAVLACALTAGCALTRPKADPTQFFVLEARPAQQARPDRPRVELAAIEVPGYLANPRMAVRTGENEVAYAEFHRWAEPLAQGIARAVTDDLSPAVDVQASPYPGRAPDYRLSVRILAFEGLRPPSGATGIRMKASWELRPPSAASPPIRGAFEAPTAAWDGKDYGQLARLLSEAVAGLCEELRRAVMTVLGS